MVHGEWTNMDSFTLAACGTGNITRIPLWILLDSLRVVILPETSITQSREIGQPAMYQGTKPALIIFMPDLHDVSALLIYSLCFCILFTRLIHDAIYPQQQTPFKLIDMKLEPYSSLFRKSMRPTALGDDVDCLYN